MACWVPRWPGRCGMGVGCGARSTPLGGGRAGGVRGNRGNPGFGGFPGFPWRLAVSSSGRCGAVLAACAVHFPRSLARRVAFVWGGRNGGLGENLEPCRGFRGRGGSGCSPSAFPDWSPLLSVYSCSRAVVFLTMPSLLCEGVWSGTRRRRAASASAQAAGGTGPGTRRAAPALAGAVLYGQYAGTVWGMCRVGLGYVQGRSRLPGLPCGRGRGLFQFEDEACLCREVSG